jgi:hypothetical protein
VLHHTNPTLSNSPENYHHKWCYTEREHQE